MSRLKQLSAVFVVLQVLSCSVVPSASAAETPVNRLQGFYDIWVPLKRPADVIKKNAYTDVDASRTGATEVNFAKYRTILGDVPEFHPDDPLTLESALVWLLRTRNVDDVANITPSSLPTYLQTYPILQFVKGDTTDLSHRTLTEDQLQALIGNVDTLLSQTVQEASNYGEDFQGKGTSSGEPYNMFDFTAASRTLPFGTLIQVTNVDNQKSVIVRINDRGPYVTNRPQRTLDLSIAAFDTIATAGQGKINVTIKRLGDIQILGNITACGQTNEYQRRAIRRLILNPGMPKYLHLGATLTLTSKSPFVIRSVRYPDSTLSSVEDWVNPGESYSLTPSVIGMYQFQIGDKNGASRWLQTQVVDCTNVK